jgi:hypothetical protein
MGPGDALASTSADLIDSALASGIKGGYRFVYSPGPKDSSGRINSYSIVAEPVDPGSTGVRSYYTDQSSTIRSSNAGPADATSPPI